MRRSYPAEDVVSESGWVKVSVTGTEDLKDLLGQLPRGEIVTWISKDWLEQVGVPAGSIRLPDKDVIGEIEGYCHQLGIELTVRRLGATLLTGRAPSAR